MHLPPISQSLNRVGSNPLGPFISFGSEPASPPPPLFRNRCCFFFEKESSSSFWLNFRVGGTRASDNRRKFSSVSLLSDSRNAFSARSFLAFVSVSSFPSFARWSSLRALLFNTSSSSSPRFIFVVVVVLKKSALLASSAREEEIERHRSNAKTRARNSLPYGGGPARQENPLHLYLFVGKNFTFFLSKRWHKNHHIKESYFFFFYSL